jgi:hypothetical protein
MQLDFIATSPTYTLADHLKLLEDMADKVGARSWKTMLLSEAQKSELEEQLVDLKLAEVLTPAEKADVRLVDGAVRARAAAAIGVPVSRVNKFLEGYTQSSAVHRWLVGRKAAGKALPRTFEEYVNTLMADKVGQNRSTLRKQRQGMKSPGAAMRRA